jgi:hypothetical protein
VQAGVGGHLREPVAELPGRDPGDQAAERAAAAAAGGPASGSLPALGTGLGEVEVLDHDRLRAVRPGGGDEAADRGPQPPVAGGVFHDASRYQRPEAGSQVMS